jgi:hypothetical protein
MASSSPAHKRPRAEPPPISVRIPLNCHPRGAPQIFFMRGTFADFERGRSDPERGQSVLQEEYKEDPTIVHQDGEPMSVCSRYITWLYPKQKLDRQTLHNRRVFIDLHRRGNVLYFFKAQGNIPQWAKPPEIIHEKVMSFLDPQERASYEGATSKGVRMLAADSSALCKEVKFVIDRNDDDQKRRIQYVLENMVNESPNSPCRQGVGQVVFAFQPEDVDHLKRVLFGTEPIKQFAHVLNFVDVLCNATKNVRLKGQLNYTDMTSIAMSLDNDWEGGHLFVDELYVTLEDWRRRHEYRDLDFDYFQNVSANLLVVSTDGAEFKSEAEQDEFVSNMNFLRTNAQETSP